ncbi:hypothetical protein NC652_037004 [Populus alba x Populus x berolinensis]|nr:hypothetical protein NC652_037004 [Populus alba x Populus x berolinensis]
MGDKNLNFEREEKEQRQQKNTVTYILTSARPLYCCVLGIVVRPDLAAMKHLGGSPSMSNLQTTSICRLVDSKISDPEKFKKSLAFW